MSLFSSDTKLHHDYDNDFDFEFSEAELKEYDEFNFDGAKDIRHLARQFTNENYDNIRNINNYSDSNIPGANPVYTDDPRLDPNNDQFDSKFYVQNLRKMVESDLEYFKPSSLGVVFKNLKCLGIDSNMDYKATFGNAVFKGLTHLFRLGTNSYNKFEILKSMDGLIKPGELTLILGRPGAGCSTFLKTIACQTHGFEVTNDSLISYDGLTAKDIHSNYRGEVVYCAENETHFPTLTVGETLDLAAKMRIGKNRPMGVSRAAYAQHLVDVVLASYGLSHTRNTKIGNEFSRGISGGERKRLSIAEVILANSKIQCWDNSTRGLDSAIAYEFVKALKVSAKIQRATPLVALYQCSEDVYSLFDNVCILYEGYQIFYGTADVAKDYFLQMGYYCPPRQSTADFLTSITNPKERIPKSGYENNVPRSPQEFHNYWVNSSLRDTLLKNIDDYLHVSKSSSYDRVFKRSHNAKQSTLARSKSPYTVSYFHQIMYLVQRNYRRFKGDPTVTLFSLIGNICFALIVSSMFYDLEASTGTFYYRTVAIFFAVLFNSFSSLLEIFALYEARPVVEKHKRYALYHASADAIASIIMELPTKVVTNICFNSVVYFMVGLRREPGPFFFYLLIGFSATLTMSHLFRSLGSATKSLAISMTPAALLLLALVIFAGFVIPAPDMLGWCRWINYINPIGYAYEAFIVNEFHGRDFPCSTYVPSGLGYPNSGNQRSCTAVGSVPGQDFVNGDIYVDLQFNYSFGHRWRNFGIIMGFAVAFFIIYAFLCEYNRGARQKGEILVFKTRKNQSFNDRKADIESGPLEKPQVFSSSEFYDDGSNSNPDKTKNKNIFHWRHMSYEIKVKSEAKTILNDIDGWVRPGQVTALMGASGAGKTTLLNALSDRLNVGYVTNGRRMVNGNSLDYSFQRSIGYVQQNDIHLSTCTVKEALKFSAYLRQSRHVSKEEKDKYVDYIINVLDMDDYSDAIIGVEGEGLNIEQRKRLTIGVELVAKPKLLVFLDEPTSGLDSQTAWSICRLLRKLADHGQAILCTIHQPSAILLDNFDRLLLLHQGKTIYFGDFGKDCNTLINYFEKYGAPKCPDNANPADWMLEVIGAAPGYHANQDYHQVWRNSSEYHVIQKRLSKMEKKLSKLPRDQTPETYYYYSATFSQQYFHATKRVFEQYWRSPTYLYSKVLMSVLASIFNGFSFFRADNTLQGLRNQMFSVFMFLVLYNTLVQQYLPYYVEQRQLYEARERPSKTLSWVIFVLAQITAEIPWNIFCGTLAFCCWYFPIGFYNNAAATNTANERAGLMWFLTILFFNYASSMGQLCISFLEMAQKAAYLANFLFSICLNFCGVLVTAEDMPRFWIFMHVFNPFTYLVSAMLSDGLANSPVTCSAKELIHFEPPNDSNCGEYMSTYMQFAGGYLVDPKAIENCQFCRLSSTNGFLNEVHSYFGDRYNNMGIFIAFIIFNWVFAFFFYWLMRVPKRFSLGRGSY